MATIDFNSKEVPSNTASDVQQQQQAYYQQIVIENSRNMDLSYCERQQKYKPQSQSVAGGIFLLIVSGGMHMGWGIWRLWISEPWSFYRSIGIIQFALMSWYVFAVVGSMVGAILVTRVGKKLIYYIGGAFLIASNIMFIVMYSEHEGVIVGRCLAGFAHGIIYNAVVTHAAENVMKEIRGMLLSSVHCTIFAGVFVGTIVISLTGNAYYREVTSDRLFGIFGLVFTIMGLICNTFLTYESIPFLLKKDNESEAVINLLKLRNESVMLPTLINELNEMKLMVGQDKQESQNILSNGNVSVTGKMIVLRVLSTMTNNYLINYILISTVATLFNLNDIHYAPATLAASRFVGSFFPVFLSDFIKRKIQLTVSSVISGLLMLVLAIIVAAVTFSPTSPYWILGAICIAFEVFVSFGIDPMQHVLLSEAFSTSKKAWSIAVVTSVEYCLQILFIGVAFLSAIDTFRLNVILFVTAGIILVLGLFLQFAIPETFKKSIKETRDLFRG